MCFSTPSVSTSTVSAAPTTVTTGDSEAMQQQREKDRNNQRAAAGYSKNILAGSAPLSAANLTKNTLLGQ